MSVKRIIQNNKEFCEIIDKYLPREDEKERVKILKKDIQIASNANKYESGLVGIASEYLFFLVLSRINRQEDYNIFDNFNAKKGLDILKQLDNDLYCKIYEKYNYYILIYKLESCYTNVYKRINLNQCKNNIASEDLLELTLSFMKGFEESIKDTKTHNFDNPHNFYFELKILCEGAIFFAKLENIYKSRMLPIQIESFLDPKEHLVEELEEMLHLFINIFTDNHMYGIPLDNVQFHPEFEEYNRLFSGFEVDFILNNEAMIECKSSKNTCSKNDWRQFITYVLFIIAKNVAEPKNKFVNEFSIYYSRYGFFEYLTSKYYERVLNDQLVNDLTNLTEIIRKNKN